MRPLLIGFSIFLLLLVLTQFLTYQRYLLNKVEQRERVMEVAVSAKNNLLSALGYSLAATNTLAFIVENYGVPEDFDAVAKGLLGSGKFIDAIELTREGTITHIYPLKGNEGAIGYDILADPARKKEALKAIEKRELFFAGPFALKQGGFGVVGRQPIFRDRRFFGFAVVIIRFSTLVKAIGVNEAMSDEYLFQLSKINPDTKQEEFFLPRDDSFDKAQFVSIPITNGEWNLYVKPIQPKTLLFVLPNIIMGIIFSLAGGFFAWFISVKPEKLQEEVEEKNLLMEQAQSMAHLGNWQWDVLTDTFTWSDELYAIYALTKETFQPTFEGYLQYVHVEDRDRVQNIIQSTLAKKDSVTFDERIIRPNGEIRYLKSWGRVKLNDAGVPIKMFGASLDVTEATEAELKRAHAEQRFKSMVQEGSDLISILDHEGNYYYVSPACVAILGRPQEDFFRQNAFDFIHPEDRDRVIADFDSLRSLKKIQLLPFRFLDGQNKYRWLETTVTNLMDDPAVRGLVANSSDITARINYISAIEEQNRTLREIAWMQSHVVRAPLARIMGLVNLLLMTNEEFQEMSREDVLGHINRSAHELDAIIRDIVRKTERMNKEGIDASHDH